MRNTAIILGAPRSGTNMLRDALTALPGVGSWPCDEINYIWRHGNVRHPSDELGPELATPEVIRYIRRKFHEVGSGDSWQLLVEKTCANSLRVEFVDRVVPEARYVVIRRDGLDAVASALVRWNAKLDIPYLAAKARYVPASDLPYYGAKFLWNRLYRGFSGKQRLAFWGPQFEGYREELGARPLDEVCALQWQRCVERTADALAAIPGAKVVEVAYERLVSKPVEELERIVAFLGLSPTKEMLKAASSSMNSNSVGKGRGSMNPEAVRRIESLVGRTLQRYGYA